MAFQWQPATQADIGHVFSLVLNGARNGHFEPTILAQKSNYRTYLQSAIHLLTDPRGYRTEVLTGWVNHTRVGAAVITEAIGTPDIGVEIAMIAIKGEFQGAGFGSLALDALLPKLLKHGSVYARCFPASHKLQSMLLSRDFREVGSLGQATILRRERFDDIRYTDMPFATHTLATTQTAAQVK